MRFGLDDSVIEKLTEVFEASPKVDKAYIFGSRAKGNFRADSDIDIAIKGFGLTLDDILKMSVAFDDKGILFKIDLLDYDEIKEPALIEHIDRVGMEFYSRWKERKLGEFIEVTNGYAFKSVDFLENPAENTLPIIKIKNVANGDVHLNDVQFHNYSDKLSKFVAGNNDILISLTGNHPELQTQVVGLVSKYKFSNRALINQRVAKIASKNEAELSTEFIYYFLKDTDTHQYLASQSSGSANQANISKADIENISISLPPPQEQLIITSILNSLDNKIDLLHRQNKTLEQLAETLFRQWFVEEAEEDWEIGKVSDLFILQRGHDLPSQNRTEGKYPILSSGGISGYHHDFKVKGPGVTTGRSGMIGNVFYVTEDFWPLNTSLFVKEYKIATPLFTYFFLKTLDLNTLNGGSAVPTLNRNDVHQIAVALPTQSVVIEFEKIVKIYFKKIKSNQTQIQSLTKMRDNLLPKLMSGEVRVKMPE